ncbi:hypothetical protein BTJ68_06682 [Hortaea werneckii EXF-2000]|uniref:Uncharacterized protein n=2 Tax=Hortaea werneckii TaxID=91943 RepID=A0A3M7I555_HORWE|nr:hypothetical protein BTJ68_06682 [Hortaea werneckii EXF-2000]RMZ20482.1 hypothetical protein D0859_15512 [Hortaea werneckii]
MNHETSNTVILLQPSERRTVAAAAAGCEAMSGTTCSLLAEWCHNAGGISVKDVCTVQLNSVKYVLLQFCTVKD